MGGSTRRVFSSGAAKQLRETQYQGWKRRVPPVAGPAPPVPPAPAPQALKKVSVPPPPVPPKTKPSFQSAHHSSSSNHTLPRKPLWARVNRHGPSPTSPMSAAASADAAGAADSLAAPSFLDLRLLALQRGVPFIGFGMVDNAIMIVSGDYIEMSIGVTLGIGTMTAAALGNIFADVIGLNLGGLIEEASHRMGIPEPTLSRGQKNMGVTKAVTYLGSSLGIAFGCLLGMLPLAFISNEVREETPAEVFQTLAQRAARLLGAERAVIFQLDPLTHAAVVQQYQGGWDGQVVTEGPGGLPLVLAQDVVEQVLESKGGLFMWSQRAEETYDEEEEEDAGATEALGGVVVAATERRKERTTTRTTVDSLLCLPVLDKDGQVLAIVAVVNAAAATVANGSKGSKKHDFGHEDQKTLAGLCAQVAEALINMTRRPEEHVSLSENLDLLAAHSNLAFHEYRPSLRALIFGQDGREGLRMRTESLPIVDEGKGVIGGVSAA